MKYVVFVSLFSLICGVPQWYLEKRQAFINEELAMRVGADLTLNDREKLVNNFLMAEKKRLIEESTLTTEPYLAAVHFFEAKERIDNSTIFDVIKMMPKGGVLHAHSHAITSLDWVVKNLTYLSNTWVRTENDAYGTKVFEVFDEPPTDPGWTRVVDLRAAADSADEFDRDLALGMSIWVDDPHRVYPTVNDVWRKFDAYFMATGGLVNSLYLETLYIKQAIKEFYEDGVQYIELRSGIPTTTTGVDFADDYYQMIQDAVAEFQVDHPDFIGIKSIISGKRSHTVERQKQVLTRALELMQKFPDTVKGFDLVSQEDLYHTTYFYIDNLLQNNKPVSPYFFHAGETDWTQGVDVNLVDSVLLNSSRIGHGFAALRHPKVMEAVRNKDIAIELCPISNQVLGLVTDMRDHPGAILIAEGAPIVVSSDDPPVWMATPLSHDFYYAFMGLGSESDDLRLLKQLAINSFEFSTMTDEEFCKAIQKWGDRWTQFINDVISKYGLSSAAVRETKCKDKFNGVPGASARCEPKRVPDGGNKGGPWTLPWRRFPWSTYRYRFPWDNHRYGSQKFPWDNQRYGSQGFPWDNHRGGSRGGGRKGFGAW